MCQVVGKNNKLTYLKETTLAEKVIGNEKVENEKQKLIDAIEEALAEQTI